MIRYLSTDDDDDYNDSLKLEKLGVVLSSYYRPPLKCVLCVLLVQSSGKYCAALKQQYHSTIEQITVALCTNALSIKNTVLWMAPSSHLLLLFWDMALPPEANSCTRVFLLMNNIDIM